MNMASVAFKLFYWPMCRTYARTFLRDLPADGLFRAMCSLQFYYVHRFWPNFVHPGRFTEKIWSRMLHDRNSLLTLVSDKFRVRDYVASKVGDEYLIPLLWTGDKPENIPFDSLPSQFVIKTNHGCGYNMIVTNKANVNISKAKGRLQKWVKENFCDDKYLGTEWGYRNIKPLIMIESYLGDTENAPVDYKFYCFDGTVEIFTVHFDRFIEHKTKTFDRNFNPHEFRYDFPQWAGEVLRPANFESMVTLAESLAHEFDFMRVDLYSVKEHIYFGELTPYPGGVGTKFLPARQDDLLGKKWKSK